MLRRDKFYSGFIIGLVFPVIAFVILYELNAIIVDKGLLPGVGFRLRTICVFSAVANVIPAAGIYRSKKSNAIRGIMVATMAVAMGVVFYFFESFLKDN